MAEQWHLWEYIPNRVHIIWYDLLEQTVCRVRGHSPHIGGGTGWEILECTRCGHASYRRTGG